MSSPTVAFQNVLETEELHFVTNNSYLFHTGVYNRAFRLCHLPVLASNKKKCTIKPMRYNTSNLNGGEQRRKMAKRVEYPAQTK